MLNRDQVRKIGETALSRSKFPDCTASVSATEQGYVRFANNGITTSGMSLERSVTIASTRDRKTGVASGNQTDDASLEALVRRSEELAALAPANPEFMEALGPQEYPQPADFDQGTTDARGEQMLPHIRAAIDATREKDLVAAGFFERALTISSVANKRGLFGYHAATDSRMSVTVRTRDGSSSGWAAQPAVRIVEINGVQLAARAIEKCLAWRKPRRLEPGGYEVILEPAAAGDLVRLMAMSFDARASEEGRTFLSRKGGGTLVGEKLFPESITLRSDPLAARLPSLPWTNSLLPSRPVTFVERGVVRALSRDRYWAARTKLEPVPFPSSLVLDGEDRPLEELIRAAKRAVLVTHFWYIRPVNLRTLQHTGLTRNGLFLVEDGKITAPVMNLRFTDSPVRLLEKTRMLGRPIRVRGLEGGSMIAPALLSSEFVFTSVSDAV